MGNDKVVECEIYTPYYTSDTTVEKKNFKNTTHRYITEGYVNEKFVREILHKI